MKWLAKHGHTLDEAQKVAAHELVAAKKGIDRAGSTIGFLGNAAPKEEAYINWLYQPEYQQALKSHDRAFENANKAFGPDQDLLVRRDKRIQELFDDVMDERIKEIQQVNDPRRTAFKYFQRED